MNGIYTQTTGPTIEPVTLEQAKGWLHIPLDDSSQDDEIEQLISAAREEVEAVTMRQLLQATWTVNFDSFYAAELEIMKAPISSITSITYLDTNGDSQTLATSVYTSDLNREPPIVYLQFAQTWPATYGVKNAVTITFVSGYGTTKVSVPKAALLAIKMLVESNFDGQYDAMRDKAIERLMDTLRWDMK